MSGLDPQDPFVAIVGMAGRFPRASDVATFWSRLTAGEDCVTRPAPTTPGGPTRAYGVVQDGDAFDAAFFGIAPSEALMLDPQHRVFMECAWEALERAGCDPARYPGTIGVFGGSGDTDHFGTLRAHAGHWPGVSDWQLRIASGADFLTSRVAYKLELTGPAVTVQTACSTSLVAVHVAAQALLVGDCDLALAGGVTVHVPAPLDARGEPGVVASDGHCRPFDAGAAGTVASDGAGVVALKRLEDALADGDHIHAVLRGSAVNNDGAGKMGFAAPSVDGQATAVRLAHLAAGVEPSSIGYVEAHGTGTPVGDPIEVRALAKAFGEREPAAGACVLGSVKANIGHTDAAAGVIGLIKAALALEHELIPGTAHYVAPNPEIDLAATPFAVSSSVRPWPRTSEPRRAGVNSLGLGGTNAHAVLEEPPPPGPHERGRPYQLLPLSARTPSALAASAERLSGALRSGPALEDVAWTLQTGRRAFAHRGFVVCGDNDDAARALAGEEPGRFVTGRAEQRARRVAFLFPGQGGQHVGMAGELYEHEPAFRAEVDRCAELVRPVLGLDLRTVLYPSDHADAAAAHERLKPMRVSQPALFAVEYALARLWQAWGVEPAVVVGHSLGAYVAATIAGVLTLPDALSLVLHRGRLLEGLPAGAMLAVGLPADALEGLLNERLAIAAINGPSQCVVTGPLADVTALQERLGGDGVEARLLHISAAAHSVLVDDVVDEFERSVAGVRLSPPAIRWISDRTGADVTPEQACDPAYWAGHLRDTVRFSDALQTLLEADDLALLELGPGSTLGALARRHPACGDGHLVLASLPHPIDETGSGAVVLGAAGRLWQAGVALDWPALHEGQRRRRVPLPTYPFERQRFRLDAAVAGENDAAGADGGCNGSAPSAHAGARSSTATERAVAAAFAEVLALPEVDAGESFFDLGGDSLMATRLLVLVRERLGAEVEVPALFRAPTASALATVIDGARPSNDSLPRPADRGRSRWLLRRTPDPSARVRLYCFPHSGGSPGEYLAWSGELPGVELWGVQAPGRGSRLSEPVLTTMDQLVDAIVSEVELEPPFAFFGHSLGAFVAYETAVALRAKGLAEPDRLLLSAVGAPHLQPPAPPLHQLDDAALVAALEAEYGALPRELHEDAELRRLTLVGLRADLAVLASHRHREQPPLTCPIAVLGGSDDREPRSALEAWSQYTTSSFSLRMFPGAHFYFRERRDDTLRHISATLAEPAL